MIKIQMGPKALVNLAPATLSEEIAHPTAYHHLSELSVDIQLREDPALSEEISQSQSKVAVQSAA